MTDGKGEKRSEKRSMNRFLDLSKLMGQVEAEYSIVKELRELADKHETKAKNLLAKYDKQREEAK